MSASNAIPGTGRPDFFIVGTAKAGTSSLYEYLKGHPDVFMSPVKEPNYFASPGRPFDYRGPGDDHLNEKSVMDPGAYARLFQDAGPDQVAGEASTQYLYATGTAERIHRANPDARIIIGLRHPVDRAFSSYLHLRRQDREPETDFLRALELEPERIAAGWGPLFHYRARSRYAGQLREYYDAFPADQILVYLYDELREDPAGVFRRLCRFIGVGDDYVPEFEVRYNISGIPRSRLVHRLFGTQNALKKAVRWVLPKRLRRRFVYLVNRSNLERPTLDEDVRAELTRSFATELADVSAITGLDLRRWLD